MENVILIAYALNPNRGSEAGVAHSWLSIIMKHYSVDVFTDAFHKQDILNAQYQNVKFHFIPGLKKWRWIAKKSGVSILPATIFLKAVKKKLSKFPRHKFLLLHCLTPAGVHFYNDLYKYNIPVAIGPLGGGISIPKGFSVLHGKKIIKYLIRDYYLSYLSKNKKRNQFLEHTDCIFIGTSDVKKQLPEKVHSKCVTIFDSVVDTDFYKPRYDKEQKSPVKILFVGALEYKKGVMLLIEATKLCLQNGQNDFQVQIAGSGALKDRLIKIIDECKLSDYILLLGQLSKYELLKRYQEADIFCLPTLMEPGGTAILEAMACGLPVITSNRGGPAYSVPDNCGIKINVHSESEYINELSIALIYLVNNRDVRHTMGKNGRKKIIAEFSSIALEKKIIPLYQKILKKQ